MIYDYETYLEIIYSLQDAHWEQRKFDNKERRKYRMTKEEYEMMTKGLMS